MKIKSLIFASTILAVTLSCNKDKEENIVPPPQITSITPLEGSGGDEFVIHGSDFNPAYAYTVHLMSGTNASEVYVIAVRADMIRSAISPEIDPGTYSVRVTALERSTIAEDKIRVSHSLTYFSPLSGDAGTTVTIIGTNLVSLAEGHEVSLVSENGTTIPVSITSAEPRVLKIKIPADIALGVYKIRLTIGSTIKETTASFEVINPITVTGFSPTSGQAGSTVIIEGTSFHTSLDGNAVSFEANGATKYGRITEASSTNLTVVVPENLTPGEYNVKVFARNKTITAEGKYTVTL